jgi:hypothetical protein
MTDTRPGLPPAYRCPTHGVVHVRCPDCGGSVRDLDLVRECGFDHDGVTWSCGWSEPIIDLAEPPT